MPDESLPSARKTSVGFIIPGADGKDGVCLDLQPDWQRIAARHAEEIKGAAKMLPENSLRGIRAEDLT